MSFLRSSYLGLAGRGYPVRHLFISALALLFLLGLWGGSSVFRTHTGAGVALAAGEGYISRSDLSSLRRAALRGLSSAGAGALLEMDAPSVQAMLGMPELVRRDLPTVVWQYRNDFCVLDVSFQTNHADLREAVVTHYEVRARAKNMADAEVTPSCPRNLAYNQRGYGSTTPIRLAQNDKTMTSPLLSVPSTTYND